MERLASDIVGKVSRWFRGSRGVGTSVLNALPMPVLVLDRKGLVQAVNASFQRVFALQERLPMPLEQFLGGRCNLPAIHHLVDMGDAVAEPVRIEVATGEGVRAFSLKAQRVDDTGMVWIVLTDVTALYEKSQLLEQLIDSSSDCVKVLDAEGRILSINQNGISQLDLERQEEVVGALWQGFWRGIHRERAEQALELARSGQTSRFEGFCPTSREVPKWWEVILTPLTDIEGKATRFLCISRDITQRRNTEEALRDREQQWRALAEAMPQLVWMCRADGYCEYLSQQWGEYTGLPVDTLLGQRWLEVLHPEDRMRAWQAWLDAVEGIADYDLEYRIRRMDGAYRWFRTRAVPVRDETGKVVRWYGTCTDIQQTAEAREAAEAANIAKSEFLANMSHEIRTPMNAVVGLAHILSNSSPLTQKQRECLATLQTSADTLLSLINDLLDIAKIEAATMELEAIPFDLGQLAQEVASMVEMRAQEKKLQWRTDIGAVRGRMFIGDPKRLQQVMLNLCSNAVKFTEVGGVSLAVRCEGDGQACRIAIAVTDTGIGISHDKKESIFQKFVQADSSIGRRYGGTGLGLAITRQLVELMGGEIDVESAPGEGSCFTVRLTMAEAAGVPLPVAVAEPPVETPVRSVRGKVLLVEDYAPNVLVATTFLDMFGYAYEVANNGVEALERVRGEAYHAVLMDVQMHEMDGLETTRRIRRMEQEEGRAPLHIIGMTAHALAGDRERCIEAGMDDYLTKPFDPDMLERKLAALGPEKKAA